MTVVPTIHFNTVRSRSMRPMRSLGQPIFHIVVGLKQPCHLVLRARDSSQRLSQRVNHRALQVKELLMRLALAAQDGL